MTIHPFHSTILLPPLHLSDNQSINTSICAPIQQFIYPSIYLPIIQPFVYHLSIHPSLHTHTLASISFQQLHQDCTSVVWSASRENNRLYVRLPNRQTENKKALRSINGASCNHSCNSIILGKCKVQQQGKTIKNADRKHCIDAVSKVQLIALIPRETLVFEINYWFTDISCNWNGLVFKDYSPVPCTVN